MIVRPMLLPSKPETSELKWSDADRKAADHLEVLLRRVPATMSLGEADDLTHQAPRLPWHRRIRVTVGLRLDRLFRRGTR